MKIPVKIEKVITEEKDIEIPKVITHDHKHFNDVIDYLKSLEFLAGSHHYSFKEYIGYSQGGVNSSPIKWIEIIHDKCSAGFPSGKITIRVGWDNNCNPDRSSILIFRRSIIV